VSLVDDALAGAPRRPVEAAARSALVVGNVGKLGAELLNTLLESLYYRSVTVAVRRRMQVHLPKLETTVVQDDQQVWEPAAGKRAPDDAFLCIETPVKSFWKTEKPYLQLSSARAASLAARLRAAGTRRVAVITPLEALLQMGSVPVIRDTDELSIVNAGFERVLVLRPVQEAGREAGQGFFGTVGSVVVRTLGSYMSPKDLQPVRLRRAAQAAVDTLATMDDGVQIVGAARLRELVGDPLSRGVL
jgi:hypothetical protein